MEKITVQQAREVLKANGYLVGNLWSRDDIKAQHSDNYTGDITEEEVTKVMEYIEENYDAEHGIDWYVIDNAIYEVIND